MSGRATWYAARGGGTQGGNISRAPSKHYSTRDLPAHLKLKERPKRVERDAEEIDSEPLRKHYVRSSIGLIEDGKKPAAKKEVGDTPVAEMVDDIEKAEEPVDQVDDSDTDSADEDDGDHVELLEEAMGLDADDVEEDDESSDEDSDEEEAELLKELEKIKKERAEQEMSKQLRDEERRQEEEREAIVKGNPLLNLGGSGDVDFSVKQRWTNDSVFKNQARKEKEEGKKFINDTLRNEFHKKFLGKYIR